MYSGNLDYVLKIRITEGQKAFLEQLADINGMSVSEVVRKLLLLNQLGMEEEFYGNSETAINN